MSRTFFRGVATGLCLIGVAGAITVRATATPSTFAPSELRRTSPTTPTTPTTPTPPTTPLQAKPVDAPALYKLHCQMCHGANGKAPMPEMAFIDRKWTHGTSSAQMVKVITEGVKGTPMMPFKNKLKPEQIAALATLVRSFDKKLKPEKS